MLLLCFVALTRVIDFRINETGPWCFARREVHFFLCVSFRLASPPRSMVYLTNRRSHADTGLTGQQRSIDNLVEEEDGPDEGPLLSLCGKSAFSKSTLDPQRLSQATWSTSSTT